jgi:hypothetical protein
MILHNDRYEQGDTDADISSYISRQIIKKSDTSYPPKPSVELKVIARPNHKAVSEEIATKLASKWGAKYNLTQENR